MTEDKADINVRVAWSGVGINLASNEPTSEALREAVRAVLDKPNYRARALAMAQEFGSIDTRSEILRILEQVSGIPGTDKGRRIQSGSSLDWSVVGLGRQKALRQRGTNGTNNARYPGIPEEEKSILRFACQSRKIQR